MILKRILLYPLALLYGLIMQLRNKLYDWHIFHSQGFLFPVISVGNLSVGGTGKTPMVEYIIRLLRDKHRTATLSRGYGRDTSGFLLAGEESGHQEIGDEPMQYYSKFQDVVVAVDENRVKGIQNLLKHYPDLKVVVLDDAFQHRRLRPGLSILLTDYHHLYSNDLMLPSGLLREPVSGAKRADVIIVTKTPEIFSPITRRQLIEELNPRPWQHIFFSYIGYDAPVKLTAAYKPKGPGNYSTILLLAGIANPYPLEYYLRSYSEEVITLKYPDHHPYSQEDVLQIRKTYEDLYAKKKVIITTEKDAMRLQSNNLLSLLEGIPIAYIPVRVKFHNSDKEKFDRIILNYVEKDLRDHQVPSEQGDQ